MAQLQATDVADAVSALRGLLALAPGWTDLAGFVRAWNVTEKAQAAMIDAAGAIAVGDLAITQQALDGLAAAVTEALGTYHRDAQDQPGLQPERLRLLLRDRPPARAFRGIAGVLLQNGTIGQDGPWLRLPTHRVTLSPADENLWNAAQALVAADRFRPPRTRDLAKVLGCQEPAMRALLKRLQSMGRVIEIAPDHFFLRGAVAEMARIAHDATGADGLLTAAAFRDRLDNGRKVAIQILEFFDRAGVTIRDEDKRRVRPDRVMLFGLPE